VQAVFAQLAEGLTPAARDLPARPDLLAELEVPLERTEGACSHAAPPGVDDDSGA